MQLVPQVAFWISVGVVLYSYCGYPLLVWLLSRLSATRPAPSAAEVEDVPEVTLLIAAHNEEEVIESKIRNGLSLVYPQDRLQIVVASDGSADGTAEIVRRFTDEGVRLLDYSENRGKSATLNAAIAETGSEILVLSDANTLYDEQAIGKLVRWFQDPQVHTAVGRLVLTDPEAGNNVDSVYWRYETFLKRCEGRLGALLGANGAIYAIRRNAYVPIPNNTIVDDFVIPLLSKLRRGGRIVYDPEAFAREETAPTMGGEFRRRARIGAGAYQSLTLLWRLLHPKFGWTAFAFLSHKVLRWLVPFFLIGMLGANLLLLNSRFYQLTLAFQLLLIAVSIAGVYLPGRGKSTRVIRVATMFFGMNLALLAGFWRWLTATQAGTWQRTAR